MDSEFSRKKALVLGVLSLVFLAIPVTVYTALQQQSSSSKAAEVTQTNTTDTVFIINEEQITKSDVRKVAEEQYPPELVDQLALQDALLILKERKILDYAVNSNGIILDQARVERFKKDGFSDSDAKYEALKQQIILSAVNSREVSSIGFWNSPADSLDTISVTEQADAAEQLEVGIPALMTIEAKMKEGKDLGQITKEILDEVPELNSVLALNGYIYSKLDDVGKAMAINPQIYEYGSSGLNDQTRDVLFVQNEGAVIKIIDTQDNRAGYVYKLITKGNASGYKTYEEWLEIQMNTLVQNVGTL